MSSPLTLILFDLGWPTAFLASVLIATVKEEIPALRGCYQESWEVTEEKIFGAMVPITVLRFPELQALLLLDLGLRKAVSAQRRHLEGLRKP